MLSYAFSSLRDSKAGSLLLYFCDREPVGFWHFSLTADLQVFGIFRDHGPASFWHFSVTADQRVFGIFT